MSVTPPDHVPDRPPPPAPLGSSMAPVSPRSPGPVAIILIALVAVAVILAGAWYWRCGAGSGAEQAATAFFRANADEGAQVAYASTAPTFRDVTPESTWTRTSEGYRLARLSDVDWTQHNSEGNVTTVRGTIQREGLPPLPVAVDLRRIDGTWKVATVLFEASAEAGTAVPAATQAPVPETQAPAPSQYAAPSASAGEDTPGPVMSVPRSGPGPEQDGMPGEKAPLPSGGRSGPSGSMVAAGQVGPTCMSQLWKLGLHTTGVDCPLYLPTRPGATEQCVAHTQAGTTVGVTVTYLDYDPVSRNSAIDCRAN